MDGTPAAVDSALCFRPRTRNSHGCFAVLHGSVAEARRYFTPKRQRLPDFYERSKTQQPPDKTLRVGHGGRETQAPIGEFLNCLVRRKRGFQQVRAGLSAEYRYQSDGLSVAALGTETECALRDVTLQRETRWCGGGRVKKRGLFDCALSYGLVEYLRTLDMLKKHGWVGEPQHPAWWSPDVAEHRRRPRFWRQRAYPDLFQPYGGFPGGAKVENGHVTPPDLAGIGFEGKADLYREMRAVVE